MFKQFKVSWMSKYCKENNGSRPLTAELRSCMQHVIDNRKNLMRFGKFKNCQYDEFHNLSTEYHKQYFLNIDAPEQQVKTSLSIYKLVITYVVLGMCLTYHALPHVSSKLLMFAMLFVNLNLNQPNLYWNLFY